MHCFWWRRRRRRRERGNHTPSTTTSSSHLINTCTVPATLTLGSRRDQTYATLNVKDMVIASDYKLRLLVI